MKSNSIYLVKPGEYGKNRITIRYNNTPKININNGYLYTIKTSPSKTNNKTIVIEEGITHLYKGTFCGAHDIKRIYLPKSLVYIEPGTFNECINLSYISINKYNKIYRTHNNIVYHVPTKTLFVSPQNNRSKIIVIPSGIKHIEAYAFYNNRFVEYIFYNGRLMTATISTIGKFAFANCYLLKECNINLMHCASIGEFAFAECWSLTHFIYYKPLTENSDIKITLNKGTFLNCYNLKIVIIPHVVNKILDGCFCNCYNLESIYYANNSNINFIYFYNKMRFNYFHDLVHSIPYSATKYKLSHKAKLDTIYHNNIIYLPNTLIELGNLVFNQCNNIDIIFIPNKTHFSSSVNDYNHENIIDPIANNNRTIYVTSLTLEKSLLNYNKNINRAKIFSPGRVIAKNEYKFGFNNNIPQ